MTGDESIVSRFPNSPAKTGQVPMFLHLQASSRNASGGSSNEINSPPVANRTVWVETKHCENASCRVEPAGELKLEIRTAKRKISAASQLADISTNPARSSGNANS